MLTLRRPIFTTGCSVVDSNQILLGFDVISCITLFMPTTFSNITCACLKPLINLPSRSGFGHILSSSLL